MKKTIAILAILVFALQACTTVRFTESGQTIKEQTRAMYVIGLFPINNNNFKSGPSYTTKMDFLDWVIGAVTGGIIQSRSVIPGGM